MGLNKTFDRLQFPMSHYNVAIYIDQIKFEDDETKPKSPKS